MIVMPPVEAASSNAIARRSSRLTAVVVAVGIACGVWAVIELAFGLDLRGPALGRSSRPTDVGLEQVAIGSLAVSLAGWALLAALERLAARPRRVWTVIAVFVLLASLGGATSGAGVTTANRVSLSLLHLVVGVSVITLLRRTATAARDALPPKDVDADRRRTVARAGTPRSTSAIGQTPQTESKGRRPVSDLHAIADRVEIEALRGEYTDAGMMRDHHRFASLFTDDGALRWPHIEKEFVGRQEIRAAIERAQGVWDYFVQTSHPGTIRLEGDTATGRAYIAEFGRFRDGSSHLNYAVYHDRYRRTPDGWKFAERVYEVRYVDTTALAGSAPDPSGDAR